MPMNRNLYAVSAGDECRYPDKISVSAEFIIRNCRPRIGLGFFYMKNPDFSSRNWLGPPQPYFVDVAWFCRDRMQTVISPFVFSPFNSRPDVKAELQGIIFPDMIFYHCNIPYLLIEENNNQIIKRLYINYSERIMTNMALSMGLQPTETFPARLFDLGSNRKFIMYAWIIRARNGTVFYPLFPEDGYLLQKYDLSALDYEIIKYGVFHQKKYWKLIYDRHEGHIFTAASELSIT